MLIGSVSLIGMLAIGVSLWYPTFLMRTYGMTTGEVARWMTQQPAGTADPGRRQCREHVRLVLGRVGGSAQQPVLRHPRVVARGQSRRAEPVGVVDGEHVDRIGRLPGEAQPGVAQHGADRPLGAVRDEGEPLRIARQPRMQTLDRNEAGEADRPDELTELQRLAEDITTARKGRRR